MSSDSWDFCQPKHSSELVHQVDFKVLYSGFRKQLKEPKTKSTWTFTLQSETNHVFANHSYFFFFIHSNWEVCQSVTEGKETCPSAACTVGRWGHILYSGDWKGLEMSLVHTWKWWDGTGMTCRQGTTEGTWVYSCLIIGTKEMNRTWFFFLYIRKNETALYFFLIIFFFKQLYVNHRPNNTTYICPNTGTQKQNV